MTPRPPTADAEPATATGVPPRTVWQRSCGCVEEAGWTPDDPAAPEAYAVLMEFLAPLHVPSAGAPPATAIICLGSKDMHVPITAAELYHQGAAPWVVCTGGVELLDGRSEADVFAAELVAHGVPADRIVVERESAHTHDNVVFGMEVLRGLLPSSGAETVIAVAWPFVTRRCVATFALRYPEVVVRPVPAFCRPGEPAPFTAVTARWSVEQLDRLAVYAERGHVARVALPPHVEEAGERMRALTARRAQRAGSSPASSSRPDGQSVHGVLERIGEAG